MKLAKLTLTLGLLLFFAATIPSAWSAENRTWTDLKGRSFPGSLIKVDGDEAVIQQQGGGQVRVKRAILSARDNEYLAEYGGADSAIVEGAKVGTPEKSAKIDTKTFKELDDVFIFPDTEIDFKMLESDHFLTMTHGRVRPKDVAETAERLWAGMAFQHPGFADKWGDRRRAIFVIEDEDVYKAVGRYYMGYLDKNGQTDEATKLAIVWPKVVGSEIVLSSEIADDHGLFQRARVFKVTDANRKGFRGVWTPFVTHCLAKDMLVTQAGGVSSFGGEGYFSLTTGHGYYKEIQLCGRSGTSIATAEYSDTDVSTAKGFADGTGWAKTLKDMIRDDKVKPSIPAIYKYEAKSLTSTQLVVLYSLSYYMQSTTTRLAAYTKMVERINTSRQIPEPIEVAKLFGFETVEEFEADWMAFLKSRAFK